MPNEIREEAIRDLAKMFAKIIFIEESEEHQ